MKSSRLLRRLNGDIASARTPLEADCLQAERALYFARLGHKDKAAEIFADLHQRYDPKPNVNISVWLHLAEGLFIYFEDMGAASFDKVMRAHALSVAAGLTRLHALTAAWLAQLHYMRHEVDEMARHLKDSLRIAEKNHHAARSRSCLVIAQALHHAGREDLAARWHSKARYHANEEGDDATIGALVHNMAWLRMLMWRQAVLTETAGQTTGQHALIGAESAGNLDDMMGASSWKALQPILRAQVLSLLGKEAQALSLYEEHLPAAQPVAASRLQAVLLADKAWCHARLLQSEAARECAALAQSSLCASTHIDDQAVAHSRLAQTFALVGDTDAERRHQLLAAEAWKENARLQSRVAALLEDVSVSG